MASKSYNIGPDFVLTGSSPSPDSAPITYTLNGKVIGQPPFSWSAAAGILDGLEVEVNGVLIGTGFTAEGTKTAGALSNLTDAARAIQQSIIKQVQVAAPAPAPAPAPATTSKPATTTATSTPAPAPAPAPKTTTKPATTTATPAPAITNTVPNPKLKPPTDASIKSQITPTPTTKVSQPALIPAPKPTAPTITSPFTKPVPDPNAIVTTVPNPKLSTKTKVPPIVTTAPNPVTIKTPTEAITGKGGSFGGGGASASWAKQPAPVTDPKGKPLPLSTFAFTPPTSPASGITGAKAATAVKATQQDQVNFEARKDWRVRLALAPDGPTTKYMYRADFPGILGPLRATDGVVFPYTPSISVNYAATYEPTSPVHSNYKINQYTNSSVDQVNITCDFTAQDVAEANYLLAVIHFFRSMTKMFYGQDDIPKNGTPPPLCYLFGLGEYQFSALPLAITGFSYSLPNDVDYIKTIAASPAGSPQPAIKNAANTPARLGANITAGGKKPSTNYGATPSSAGVAPTYVPTKIQLAITCIPMMSRNMVSNKFSLKEYANGNLLKGTVNPGGGMW